MKYIYKCNCCDNVVVIEQSMNDTIKRNIECNKCNKGIMNQDFSRKSCDTVISCTFDSYGQFAPKDMGESSLEELMK